MNPRLSIRNKLFLSILLILLVSYTILILATVKSMNVFLEDSLAKELSENLRYAKDQYLTRANQIQFLLMHPASAPPVRERIQNRDRLWLMDAARRWHSTIPFVEILAFVDPEKRVIARMNTHGAGDRFPLAAIVDRALREKKPVVATELVSRQFLCREGVAGFCSKGDADDETLMLTVVVPVYGSDGNPVGTIVAGDIVDQDISIPHQVQEIFGRQVVVALTKVGKILPNSLGNSHFYPAILAPEILAKLKTGMPFRGDAAFGDKVYKTAIEPLSNSKGEFVGSLSVALSRDDFKGVLRESLTNILASAVIGIVLTFFTAYQVARRLASPLNELSNGVRMIESGDLRQRVNVDSTDEVGLLADAFNRMARSLEERDRIIRAKAFDLEALNRQLQEMNEQLENRVTERTAALQVEMGRLETILTSMAEGVVVTDCENRVILFNSAAQKIFETVPHRVVGQSIEQVSDREEFRRLIGHLGTMREEESRAICREIDMTVLGKKLKVSLSPLQDSAGGFGGVVMSIRDVTLENEVDRMKTDFISTVSHELKTPLTSIKGSLQLILDKVKELPAVERELLDISLRNTDRLIRLVNDILDISKIESGRMEFSFTPQNIRELVSHSLEEIGGFARKHGITIADRTTDDIPHVYGDHYRLIQVLTNLLSNAVKFSPQDGSVEITAEKTNNYVSVSVFDMGKEIQWSDRGKLFKKFQQLDNTDRRQQGGTGLGLAICKEIIERHHGRIFYAERDGGGNVFTFTVPIFEEHA